MDVRTDGTKPWTVAEGKLPGLFTVGKGADGKAGTADDVKVRFSQGNLWYGKVGEATETTFNFETNQYDTTPAIDGDWSTDHISHFYWSKTAEKAVEEEYDDYGQTSGSDVFFTNADGFKANEQTGWRTLSTAEWQYLFSYDGSGSGGQNYDNDIRRGKYNYGVTVCGKANCVLLLPDGWDETVISLASFATQNTYDESSTPKWSEMEAAGAVCLPAAGFRDESDVESVGVGGAYWSSTASDGSNAYRVAFSNNFVLPDNIGRYNGHSVRLITDASAVVPASGPDYVVMKMVSADSKYSLKWATMNLGATTVATNYATCYGDLYQWGSVNTLYDGFPWISATEGSFTWKTDKASGFVANNREYTENAATLPDANDVVKQTYPGTNWRMPTSQEFLDLANACGGTKYYDKETNPGKDTQVDIGIYWCTNYDGVAGCLFYDGTNKLFFPAAGLGEDTDLKNAGSCGYYWSSSLDTEYTDNACHLFFSSDNASAQKYHGRFGGFSVRPVSD